jgi:hypothetical protein
MSVVILSKVDSLWDAKTVFYIFTVILAAAVVKQSTARGF